jgi:acyl-CoA thioesterase
MLDGKILETLGNDRAADYYGMKVESVSEGSAVLTMEIGERHLNGNDAVHGGVTFAFADVAFALAVNSRGPAVSANSSITFCNPVRAGTLRACATEISLGRKLATYEVVVTSDDGRVVALFQGLAYRKGE